MNLRCSVNIPESCDDYCFIAAQAIRRPRHKAVNALENPLGTG
jgi:hypothetical protein